MKRYFITGTDTDCGKTYVTAKLLDYYTNSVAIKPIASGCSLINNHLVSSDAEQLTKNNHLSLDEINPWRFEHPVSPHIAAQKAGKFIDVNQVASYCMNFQAPGVDTLFIEGAGGLMVPLNENHTWLDFLKITKIPVILVVGMKLGCINHALLTASVVKANEIEFAGWIANCIDPQMLSLEENINTLIGLLKSSPLGTLSYLGAFITDD